MSPPALELPTLPAPPATAPLQSALEAAERDRLIRRAKALSWLSLAYMTAEGAIAITAATLAGSVALLGFGLDSAIEALASVIVIWRFTGTRRLSEHAEQRAQRLVAITFFLLAPYIAQDAIRTLANGEHPSTSWLGIGLSISSIIVMPLLGKTKQRIGQRLGSGATAGEGTQNEAADGHRNAPAAERHRPILVTVTLRGPVRVLLVLRAHDLVDLALHQLMHDTQAETDAEREQSLSRCPNELAERFLNLRRQWQLRRPHGRDDLRAGYLLHGGPPVLSDLV